MADNIEATLGTLDDVLGELLNEISEAKRRHDKEMDALYDKARTAQMQVLEMRVREQWAEGATKS